MSFPDTLVKIIVQHLESMLSVPTTPPTQTTAVNFSEPPATRHLLLVEAKDNISREEISVAKFDRVDVIYCSRETLPAVADKMKQFNIKWRSVNMLFHGSANVDEDSVCIFGIKMSMNRNIMMSDPNVQGLIKFTKAVCQYTDDSLYVYTCAVGVVDGLKELCLRLDKECNLKEGIFLSTNTTGNGVGQDWNVEWGTKYGFLTSGVHTNEIEHASVALFRDIKKLTFTLADERPVDERPVDERPVDERPVATTEYPFPAPKFILSPMSKETLELIKQGKSLRLAADADLREAENDLYEAKKIQYDCEKTNRDAMKIADDDVSFFVNEVEQAQQRVNDADTLDKILSSNLELKSLTTLMDMMISHSKILKIVDNDRFNKLCKFINDLRNEMNTENVDVKTLSAFVETISDKFLQIKLTHEEMTEWCYTFYNESSMKSVNLIKALYDIGLQEIDNYARLVKVKKMQQVVKLIKLELDSLRMIRQALLEITPTKKKNETKRIKYKLLNVINENKIK